MGKNKEKLDALIRRQQVFLDDAITAGWGLSDEEQSRMQELQREIDALANADTGGGEDATRQAVEAERGRIAEIGEMCRDFGMDAGDFIRNGNSVDEVRGKILEKLKQENAPLRSGIRVDETGEDEIGRAHV